MTTPEQTPPVVVSVLVTVHNEEASLPPLHDELISVLEAHGESFEILFVDDGSTDGSWEAIRALHQTDSRIRGIRFIRRFGEQMAWTAGLRHMRGQAVVIMSADGEASAENIPSALAKLREGCDIVFGERPHKHEPWWIRVGATFAQPLVRYMTGFKIPDCVSGFFVLNEQFVRTVNHYNENARYMKGLFTWLAYGRYGLIPITGRQSPRHLEKYGFWTRVRHVIQLISAFSIRPLHIAFFVGCAVVALSLIPGVLSGVRLAAEGWPAAENLFYLFVILFIAGVQLGALGVLGEYVGRIYLEVRKHPPYVVAEVLGELDHESAGSSPDSADESQAAAP